MKWKPSKKFKMKTEFIREEELEVENSARKQAKRISFKILILTITMLLFCAGFVCAGTVPMIMEWTIPVDMDGAGLGTTIKLPIPSNSANSYAVDWGDGTTDSYTTEAFPTHTYTNTVETTYTIKVVGEVHTFGYVGSTNPTTTNSEKNYYTFTQYLTKLVQWGELDAIRYGFSYCTNLSSTIPLPTSNSFSKITNMNHLFYHCHSLSGTIPEDLFKNAINVTSFVSTFDQCYALTGEIPENLFANNTKVTNFTATFASSGKLTGAIPEDLFVNNPEVTNFTWLFGGCYGLTQIPEGLFRNNTKVTTFKDTFSYCDGITEIPENLFANNPEVYDFWNVFAYSDGIKTIPEGLFRNNTKVTRFRYIFDFCTGLTSNIPEKLFANNPEVVDFRGAFEGCSGLTGTIPANLFVNNTKVTNYQDIFDTCSSLTGEIPPNLFANSPNVTIFREAFSFCSGLTGSIPVDLFKNNSKAVRMEYVFWGCTGLTGSIPETLFANTPEVTTFEGTFADCSGLTGSIPANLFANTSKVDSFRLTFSGCSRLTGEIPGEIFATNPNVTNFYATFADCSGLTGSIPANLFANTSKVGTFYMTFARCPGLTDAIPGELFATNSNVTNFYATFGGCSGLTGAIPGELFATNPNVTNFYATFAECRGLTGEVPIELFANNTGISTVPSNLSKPAQIGFHATFRGSGVTSANINTLYIGYQMFAGCNKLTNITIGDNVQAIGVDAFQLSSPYNANKLLKTNLDTANDVAIFYDWLGDYREINDLNAFTTEWTIPAGATIKLPIPQNDSNHFAVNWGDGMVETLDNTANFPSHTYTNTEETKYEIQISGTVTEFGTYDLATAPNANSNYYTFTQYVTGLKRWGSNNTTRYGFAYCTNLTGEIPVPTETTFNSVTSMKDMFKNCDGITGEVPSDFFDSMTAEVAVPADLTVSSEEDVYNSTFYECKNITSVNLDTEYVGYQMFYGANKLTDIQIQDSVQAIGTEAFQATAPYSSTNILETRVTTKNEVATAYNWVEANRDAMDGTALITEWTIPVDADRTNGTTTTNASGDTITLGPQTTIKLPIPKNNNNNYTVDWGDGSALETFDGTADFPVHTYTNTAETVYTIKIYGTVNSFGYNVGWPKPDSTNASANYYTFNKYITALKQWGELGAIYYGFVYCANLAGEIPEPTENSFTNTTTMQFLFSNCSKLTGSIPENLFKNAPNVTSFQCTFNGCSGLTGEIPEDLFVNNTKVTDFGTTFGGCIGLTSNIPENLFSNTPEVKTFSGVFKGCKGLTGSIPKYLFSNTTKVTSFNSTFNNCSGLTGEIPENLFANTKEVTSFAELFMECKGLTGNIPSKLFANTSKVTSFANTFNGCNGLSGEIPQELFSKTANVTVFTRVFANCSGLTGNIPAELFANTPKVTTFECTFENCTGLTGSIPAELFANTTEVTKFIFTFNKCTGLTGEIPATLFANTKKVKNFKWTFQNCSGLTGNVSAELFASNEVITTLPDDITNTHWGDDNNNAFIGTFTGCSNLTSASINTLYMSPSMFSRCNNLTNITIGENVQAIGTDAFQATSPYSPTNLLPTTVKTTNTVAENYDWLGDFRGATITDPSALITEWSIPVDADETASSTGTPATTIKLPIPTNVANSYTVDWGDGSTETFDNTADFPSHTYTNTTATVYTIKISGTLNIFGYDVDVKPTETNDRKNYYTFTEYLTGLKSWGELNATKYGFSLCVNLKGSIPSPTENSMKNVNNFVRTFAKCSNLTGEIPENLFENAEQVTNFRNTFDGCSGLTGSIPENLFKSTTKAAYFPATFTGCSGLTGGIPEKLFETTTEVQDFRNIFNGCSNLTGSIPENLFKLTTKVTLFSLTFNGCSSLTGTIPEKLFETTPLVTDFSSTFSGCSSLTGTIPEGLFKTTPLVTNFSSTFKGCSNLTGTIPEGLFKTTPLVTNFNNTFSGASKLIGPIPENLFAYTPDVKTFISTFSGCSNLNSEIPAKLFEKNKKVTSFEYLFYNCNSLTGSIPETLFEKAPEVLKFEGTFRGCSNLTGEIPENLFKNNTIVTTFTDLFRDCTNLSGSIPGSLFKNNPNVTTFFQTFYGCNNLTGIVTAELFATNTLAKNFERVFGQCRNITGAEIQIVTTNETNVSHMFSGCNSLKTLVLSADFKKLDGNLMFYGCNNLERIIALNPSPMTLSTNTNIPSTTILYVPNTTAEAAYEAATNYNTVFGAERIRPMLELVGEQTCYSKKGETYSDAGVLVAGFNAANSSEYTKYGYSVETAGLPIDTSTIGTKQVTYTLKYTNSNDASATAETIMTVTRDVIVISDTTLMQRETESSGVYYAIGAKRAGKTKYTADIIETITFVESGTVPSNAEASWDVSYNEDGTIMAWVIPSSMSGGIQLYDLYIGSDFNINAPVGSYNLFRNYTNCTAINNLKILDTSKATNMLCMFESCNSLTSLDVSNFNTSKVTNMLNMFSGCKKLSNLNLSSFDTELVTSMQNMFNECNKLSSLNLSNFNTSKVTNMQSMFNDCSNLTSLDVSSFNTANVITMKNMFCGCNNLTSLNISNFNTSSVTDMSFMFTSCSKLSSLDLGNFNTAKVTNMQNMFNGCSNLASLNVSSFDTSLVTSMQNMFINCSKLKTLDLRNFNTTKVNDMQGMFNNCGNLTSVDVSSFNTSSVITMKFMFSSCNNLASIDVSNFNTSNVTDMSYMFTSCSKLSSLNLSNFNTTKVSNMQNMFNNCASLKSVLLGQNFEKINGTNMFISSNNLTAIIALKENPMTLSTDTNVSSTTILYVPNTAAEAAYEAATNYNTVFGLDRIRPMLELVGDQEINIKVGETYEEAATVAGFQSTTDTDITPVEVKEYDYVLTRTGSVDTATPGQYTVTYMLKLNDVEVDTVTRTITVLGEITGEVKITGTNTYGQTLTADTSSITPTGCTFTYQWYSNTSNSTSGGNVISGATSSTYNIGSGLAGKYIYVEITVSKENYTTKTFADITDAINNTTATVEKVKLTKPTISGSYTYNGVSQTVNLTGFDSNLMNVSGNTRIDAGTQTVTVSLKDTANYEWTDGTTTNVTLNWTIEKKSLAVTWENATNFEYNGSNQAPSVTTPIDGVNGEKVNVSRTTEIEVGNYTSTASISSVTGGQAKVDNYTLTNTTKAFTITNANLVVTSNGYTGTYDGEAHGITVNCANATITYGTTNGIYDLSENPTYTNAGTYTVYYKVEKENYSTYTGSETITINKRQISVVWEGTQFTYGGIYQAPIATANSGVANETIQLVVSGAQKDAGTYTATAEIESVTGGMANKDNYQLNNESVEFTIVPASGITFEVTSLQNTFVYDGKNHTPDAIVKANGVELVKNQDYTISHINNKEVGTATIVVLGKGNYLGSSGQGNFMITKRMLTIIPDNGQTKKYGTLDPILTYTYSGNVDGEIPNFTGNLTRDIGEDVGDYIIRIGSLTAIDSDSFKTSNYDWKLSDYDVKFTIVITDISSGRLGVNPNTYVYDGTEKTPETTLKVGEHILTRSMDYVVEYENNINVGTALARATGIGNYKGVLEVTYQILPISIIDGTLTLNPTTFEYDGTSKTPATTVIVGENTLVRDKDYTVNYLNNIEIGDNTATAVVKGIGNYAGELQATFSITAKVLKGTATLSEYEYIYDKTEKRPTVTFVNSAGETLKEGVDYTVAYENNVNVGTATVIITGSGDYVGEIKEEFQIKKAELDLILEDKYAVYTRREITINAAIVEGAYEDISGLIKYYYYADAFSETPMESLPIDKGIYYVEAEVKGLDNYEDCLSNRARLIIYGAPTNPKIVAKTKDEVIIPSGNGTKENVVVSIYGSRVENAENVSFNYLYSLDGIAWQEYTNKINLTTEGTYTIYAKACLSEYATVESGVTTYEVTIDRTSPEIDDIIVPSVTDTVVIDIKVKGDDIDKIFVTEDASIDATKLNESDEWMNVGEDDETAVFELTQGDEEKTIYVWAKDKAGNITGPMQKKLILSALKIGNNNDNKTTIKFKMTDRYLHTSEIKAEDIIIYVNDVITKGKITSLIKKAITDGYEYTAIMEDVNGDGAISIGLNGGSVYDKAGNYLSATAKVATNEMTADNTLPIVNAAVYDDVLHIAASDIHMKAIMVNGEIIGRENGEYQYNLREGMNRLVVIDEYGNEVVEEFQKDKEIAELSIPNEPILQNGMKAVFWEDDIEKERDFFVELADYNYTKVNNFEENRDSKWANAKTDDGSYWVWIPRFAYKTVYYTDANRNTISETPTDYRDFNVIFLSKTTNEYENEYGEICLLPDGYKVAEAFTSQTTEGGWDNQLTGFWISKYGLSAEESEDNSNWQPTLNPLGGGNQMSTLAGNKDDYIRPVAKPNVPTWCGISISTAYMNAYYMQRDLESHLIKNAEWEATLILSESEYGRNGNFMELDTNSQAGGDLNTTSTGNVTGVYDLLGSAWEYTATYIPDSALEQYGEYLMNQYPGGYVSSGTGSKEKYVEKITVADIDTMIFSDIEKAIFNSTMLENAYKTSLVVYRGGYSESGASEVESIPVAGSPDSRVGYRAVMITEN